MALSLNSSRCPSCNIIRCSPALRVEFERDWVGGADEIRAFLALRESVIPMVILGLEFPVSAGQHSTKALSSTYRKAQVGNRLQESEEGGVVIRMLR